MPTEVLVSRQIGLPGPLTTVSLKGAVGLTGALLAGFVFAHMAGNLQIYLGAEALNGYAAQLKSMPAILWSARLVLLSALLVHLTGIALLTRRNQAARPIPYSKTDTGPASLASRTMVPTGVIILAFVIYHLLHFTLGVTDPSAFALQDGTGRHDVYSMVIRSFQQPAVAGGYIVAMCLLGLHLAHGIASLFQTLGWRRPNLGETIDLCGRTLALAIVLGNVSIPLACLVRFLEPMAG